MHHVANPAAHAKLQERKVMLQEALREQFAGYDRAALKKHSPLREYHAYYKRFKKSYHVQLQLESLLFKGKSIPNVAALVEVMFMAELSSQLLTAVHDLNKVQLPIRVDVSTGKERYIRMNGREQQLKRNDMFIADGESVLSSIIYCADQRTSITSETQNVLFTVQDEDGL
jgi:DNA/RNA-binding domain of Phe-tRNA-synthetase-like protein